MLDIFSMSGRENRKQILIEYNAEETRRALRKQDRLEGEQRDKTVSDFPKAAALGQVLKDLNFPADRSAIVRFVEQSNKPERNEVLPVVQR